jgi:hypothetical protein
MIFITQRLAHKFKGFLNNKKPRKMRGWQAVAETLGELNSGGCIKYFLRNTFCILFKVFNELFSQEFGLYIISFFIGPGIFGI